MNTGAPIPDSNKPEQKVAINKASFKMKEELVLRKQDDVFRGACNSRCFELLAPYTEKAQKCLKEALIQEGIRVCENGEPADAKSISITPLEMERCHWKVLRHLLDMENPMARGKSKEDLGGLLGVGPIKTALNEINLGAFIKSEAGSKWLNDFFILGDPLFIPMMNSGLDGEQAFIRLWESGVRFKNIENQRFGCLKFIEKEELNLFKLIAQSVSKEEHNAFIASVLFIGEHWNLFWIYDKASLIDEESPRAMKLALTLYELGFDMDEKQDFLWNKSFKDFAFGCSREYREKHEGANTRVPIGQLQCANWESTTWIQEFMKFDEVLKEVRTLKEVVKPSVPLGADEGSGPRTLRVRV